MIKLYFSSTKTVLQTGGKCVGELRSSSTYLVPCTHFLGRLSQGSILRQILADIFINYLDVWRVHPVQVCRWSKTGTGGYPNSQVCCCSEGSGQAGELDWGMSWHSTRGNAKSYTWLGITQGFRTCWVLQAWKQQRRIWGSSGTRGWHWSRNVPLWPTMFISLLGCIRHSTGSRMREGILQHWWFQHL